MFDPQWFLQDEDGRGMGGCGSKPEEFMVLKYRADLLYYQGQFQEATRLYAKVCSPLAMRGHFQVIKALIHKHYSPYKLFGALVDD